MSRDEMVKKLKESLKPDRFIHTLGVEQTAGELAPRYGIDPAQARLAGLLHDCAKGRSPDKMQPVDSPGRHRGGRYGMADRFTFCMRPRRGGGAIGVWSYG